MRISKFNTLLFFAAVVVMTIFGLSSQVAAAPGAIWTTDSGCGGVNVNLYDSKDDVYLNGGPQGGGPGLPDGNYYVQVTEPNGAVLGKSNSAVASVAGGQFVSCYQLSAIVFTASSGFTNSGYDDTTNAGGEYKVWVSSGPNFDSSESKTDNFKVKADPGCEDCQPPPAEINGIKFYDLNMDGIHQDTEPVLMGWHIELYKDGNKINETDTDIDGAYQFLVDYVAGDEYTVKEVIPANWRAITPDERTVTLGPDDQNQPVLLYGNNDFGNIRVARLAGIKYYDANQNGQFDVGEVGVQGIQINITVTLPDDAATVVNQTVYTGANGSWQSDEYPEFSTYSITETLPSLPNGSWIQTGTTSYNGTIGENSNGLVSGLNFFNYCTLTPGGRTIGFWSNKNGQSLLNANDFVRLTNFSLRNANGTDKDFTSPTLNTNKSAYNSWLLSANATNMAYMLSAQMSATSNSVEKLFTNPNVLVGVDNNGNWLTVAGMITYANSLLAANGNTTASGPARTEQERVKNILDKINNNGSFVQPTPCSVSYGGLPGA